MDGDAATRSTCRTAQNVGRPTESDTSRRKWKERCTLSEIDEESWVLPPRRQAGTCVVYEFEGIHDRVPEMLEMIAAWLRECAEYALEQIALHTEDGWSIISVIVHEISAGDLIEQLTTEGHAGLAESSRRS